ncbi:putative histone-binding protein Caf1 [Trichinella britovi]|uniref:Putative histone-binding protein Caf1 n=1 Tax=Trichinella britovi TaxID=45882 RepID=A0A0V1CVG0_TRIBR|nr:putative histone-binding protein Caf1 [Trichinella britovi]
MLDKCNLNGYTCNLIITKHAVNEFTYCNSLSLHMSDRGNSYIEVYTPNEAWRANVPFLYDLLIVRQLSHPCMTAQWTPATTPVEDSTVFMNHKLLLGTNNETDNFLMLANVQIPSAAALRSLPPDNDELVGSLFDNDPTRFKIQKRIPHPGEVNCIKHMPHFPQYVATKSMDGDIYLFDCNKYSENSETNSEVPPEARLCGHSGEGYGLSWNPGNAGYLLSSAEDRMIFLWDVKSVITPNSVLEPIETFTGHEKGVQDVQWHFFNENVFGSVGDDEKLMLWDTRLSGTISAMLPIHAHEAEINCLAFSPLREHMLATGSADKTIALWDLRNMTGKFHVLTAHTDEVLKVQWAPFNEAILATSASDSRVNIWNLADLGVEQSADDNLFGPSDLCMVVIQEKLVILVGTLSNLGQFVPSILTTWCNVGKLLIAYALANGKPQ